ncbi:MAG: hypothetical protein M0R03_18905 [Novosphingobium sp.]|nr:hypothetical protein [Novosphingobium sp.]
MKRKIRLNESQLNDMIGRVVDRVIREGYQDADLDDEYEEYDDGQFNLTKKASRFVDQYIMGNKTDARKILNHFVGDELENAIQYLINRCKGDEHEVWLLCLFLLKTDY